MSNSEEPEIILHDQIMEMLVAARNTGVGKKKAVVIRALGMAVTTIYREWPRDEEGATKIQKDDDSDRSMNRHHSGQHAKPKLRIVKEQG